MSKPELIDTGTANAMCAATNSTRSPKAKTSAAPWPLPSVARKKARQGPVRVEGDLGRRSRQ